MLGPYHPQKSKQNLFLRKKNLAKNQTEFKYMYFKNVFYLKVCVTNFFYHKIQIQLESFALCGCYLFTQ